MCSASATCSSALSARAAAQRVAGLQFVDLKPEHHILQHRQMRKGAVLLKNHAAIAPRTVHRLASDNHVTFGRFQKTGDQIQKCALAAAGGTDDRYEFSAVRIVENAKGNIVHSRERAKPHADAAEFQNRVRSGDMVRGHVRLRR